MTPAQTVVVGVIVNVAGGCVAAVNGAWLLASIAFFVAGFGLLALLALLVRARHIRGGDL